MCPQLGPCGIARLYGGDGLGVRSASACPLGGLKSGDVFGGDGSAAGLVSATAGRLGGLKSSDRFTAAGCCGASGDSSATFSSVHRRRFGECAGEAPGESRWSVSEAEKNEAQEPLALPRTPRILLSGESAKEEKRAREGDATLMMDLTGDNDPASDSPMLPPLRRTAEAILLKLQRLPMLDLFISLTADSRRAAAHAVPAMAAPPPRVWWRA